MNAQVRPVEGLQAAPLVASRTSTVAGLVWLGLGLGTSVSYLFLLAPTFANDLYWPAYNTSGYQTFVVDTLNYFLEAVAMGEVDLASVAVLGRNYGGVATSPQPHPTYAMARITAPRTALVDVVHALRNMSMWRVAWLPTQYCWVDLGRRWDLAHTEARQARCTRYLPNAAVYLDTVLRNSAMATMYSSSLYYGIEEELMTSDSGRDWLTETANVKTTVVEEAALWARAGLKTWTLQWQNYLLPGVDESVVFLNALGIERSVVVKASASTSGPWTSMIFNGLFITDAGFAVMACNQSLIRSAPNFFLRTHCDALYDPPYEGLAYLPYVDGSFVNQAGAVRKVIGPFLSVDLWVVPVPAPLSVLVQSFRTAVAATAASAAWEAAFPGWSGSLLVAPMPPAWEGSYVYYGGSPLCLNGDPQPFVQPPFAATDTCNAQVPWRLELSPESILFGLVLPPTPMVADICGAPDNTYCEAIVTAASTLLPHLRLTATLDNATTTAIAACNVSLIQLASDEQQSNWSLLLQPLAAWPFFGAVMLLDWALGKREVVKFEGDHGALILISDAYDESAPTTTVSSLGEASRVLSYLVVYSSVVLVGVTLLCLFHIAAQRTRLHSNSLVFFQRVAGSTWLGRPLVFLRGGTAVLLLSTAPVKLRSMPAGGAQLELPPRSLLTTSLLASEATWIGCGLHELCVPLYCHNARLAGVVSTAVVWLTYVVLATMAPVTVTTTLERQCVVDDVYAQLHCTSGTLVLGSLRRILVLLIVQGMIVPLVIAIVGLVSVNRQATAPMTVSGAGMAFLLTVPLDTIAGVLCGLVSLPRTDVFDIKLWVRLKGTTMPTVALLTAVAVKNSPWQSWFIKLFGLAIVAMDISSSMSYLQIARASLANDILWPAFNMTGTHVFLATWFLHEVALGSSVHELSDPVLNSEVDLTATSATLSLAAQAGAKAQYAALTTLADAVGGLRAIAACDAPWVFTQYCYLDFGRRWPMAHSARRQQRCAAMTANGAVFLESLLRNVHWDEWERCWGNAFAISFAAELQQSIDGRLFLGSLGGTRLSVPAEVAHWASLGITEYVLQWQNFKAIGIVDTYEVVNAFGVAYPFTLQSSAGYSRLSRQTSFKMYWGLANDLSTVATNATAVLGGKSLLRSSAAYAFVNASLQDVYYELNVIFPTAATLALEQVLGPFGTIDTMYVAVPSIMRQGAQALSNTIRNLRVRSRSDAANYVAICSSYQVTPIPAVWLGLDFYALGGSPLCPPTANAPVFPIRWGMYELFSFSGACADTLIDAFFVPGTEQWLFAFVFAAISSASNMTAICSQVASQAPLCLETLRTVDAFLDKTDAATIYKTWASAMTDAIAPLQIELLQFGRKGWWGTTELYLAPLLDRDDSSFHLFGWLLIDDWIRGHREVVAFEGDNGTLTLVGNTMTPMTVPVDNGQLPTVFALYALRGVQYVTAVMIMLASVSLAYSVISWGCIEGRNLLKLSRVGGMVWIGRPLVSLRSVTALCLLSRGTVALVREGPFNQFTVQSAPWYATVLAANEVTWLLGIVNDVGLIWTASGSPMYTTLETLFVWLVSACVTMLAPVSHSVAVERTCSVALLDFDVVCRSGTVTAGSWPRLVFLMGIVAGSYGVGVLFLRRLWPSKPHAQSRSLLVSGSAMALFYQTPWIVGDVYYMDRASAALNGLLSARYNESWVIFDVKTWRLVRLPARTEGDIRFQRALPLRNNA
ncbi:hypothetical protein ACHHYP_12012 [Achlya hypogyna]|uniref:Uncharacterized protein n=1 Tax=Achlya hypogyna TaxID=1202772 RepID=A0A1V9YHS6_ACHHY|nr:hypothetical protein ACHHYP_12012 [Achlya hypogyna]